MSARLDHFFVLPSPAGSTALLSAREGKGGKGREGRKGGWAPKKQRSLLTPRPSISDGVIRRASERGSRARPSLPCRRCSLVSQNATMQCRGSGVVTRIGQSAQKIASNKEGPTTKIKYGHGHLLTYCTSPTATGTNGNSYAERGISNLCTRRAGRGRSMPWSERLGHVACM